MSDRKIFGLLVRVAGIAMVVYALGYLQGALSMYTGAMASTGYSSVAYLIAGGFALLAGVVFIRGEWIVRFAYGPE